MYVLTWVYCGKVNILVQSENIKLIQHEKTKLNKQPQYKKGFFEVRTKEGLKHKSILK